MTQLPHHLLLNDSCLLSQVLATDLDFDVKRLQSKKVFLDSSCILDHSYLCLRSSLYECVFFYEQDTASLRERGDIKNKNLKRMKLNTQISTSLSECNLVENEDGNFLLPDLNLMPCEEATLYDISIVR